MSNITLCDLPSRRYKMLIRYGGKETYLTRRETMIVSLIDQRNEGKANCLGT